MQNTSGDTPPQPLRAQASAADAGPEDPPRYAAVGSVQRDGDDPPHLVVSVTDHWLGWGEPGDLRHDGVRGVKPYLAAFQGALHCVFLREVDDHMQIFHTTSGRGRPGTWTVPIQLPFWSACRPALCEFRGVLYLVYRGYLDQNLWWAHTRDGLTWVSEGTIGPWGSHMSYLEPALAVSAAADRLMCVHRGMKSDGADDNRLWSTGFDGERWSDDAVAMNPNGYAYPIIGAPSAARWHDGVVAFAQLDEERSAFLMTRGVDGWAEGFKQPPLQGQLLPHGDRMMLLGIYPGDRPEVGRSSWICESSHLMAFGYQLPLFIAQYFVVEAPSGVIWDPWSGKTAE